MLYKTYGITQYTHKFTFNFILKIQIRCVKPGPGAVFLRFVPDTFFPLTSPCRGPNPAGQSLTLN